MNTHQVALIASFFFLIGAIGGIAIMETSKEPLRDPLTEILADEIRDLQDLFRCEKTSTFPTADGDPRTIVIYVCSNSSLILEDPNG